MTLTGIAMGVAGRTAPLSGTEHLLSHLLDMAAGAAGRPLAFHGAQVGVAAVVVAATVWHDTCDRFDPAGLMATTALPARRRQSSDGSARRSTRSTRAAAMADECWRDVATQARALARVARAAVEPSPGTGIATAPRSRALRPRARADRGGPSRAPVRRHPLRRARPGAAAGGRALGRRRSCHLMRDRFTVADLRPALRRAGWDEATPTSCSRIRAARGRGCDGARVTPTPARPPVRRLRVRPRWHAVPRRRPAPGRRRDARARSAPPGPGWRS